MNPNRLIPAGGAMLALTGMVSLGGCIHVGWNGWSSWNGSSVSGRNVHLAAFDDRPAQHGLASRTMERSFPANQRVKIHNLAGRVDLETGAVADVQVIATVYADAGSDEATARLLDGVGWTTFTDPEGRRWDRLTIPPIGPAGPARGVHYPGLRSGEVTLDASGLRAEVHDRRSPGVPTMFADLRIVMPASASVEVRSVVGHVGAAELSGDVTIDTVWGDVAVAGCDGALNIDTGSGDITVDRVQGRLVADTGSGDVTVGHVDGSVEIDTGSGDVRVAELLGDGSIDTGSGQIEIESAEGSDLRADTGSGDVAVHRGRLGVLHVETGSGDVELRDVEFDTLHADTGAGEVYVGSSLRDSRQLHADTSSGDVTIEAGPEASFRLSTSIGSGRVIVGYDDATPRWDDDEIVGATRGDGHTLIHVDTGSGDCVLRPR